jgi:hypothetical protein
VASYHDVIIDDSHPMMWAAGPGLTLALVLIVVTVAQLQRAAVAVPSWARREASSSKNCSAEPEPGCKADPTSCLWCAAYNDVEGECCSVDDEETCCGGGMGSSCCKAEDQCCRHYLAQACCDKEASCCGGGGPGASSSAFCCDKRVRYVLQLDQARLLLADERSKLVL